MDLPRVLYIFLTFTKMNNNNNLLNKDEAYPGETEQCICICHPSEHLPSCSWTKKMGNVFALLQEPGHLFILGLLSHPDVQIM